jgi:hypothetical protein
MAEVRDEIWVLLARYLCGEASPSECLIVELLLNENEELRTLYYQLELDYLMNEKNGHKDTFQAFARLDERIKKSSPSGK